jgi:hypothetical protein
MQLWQLDIVYGTWVIDTTTGELWEMRIRTGVDDHSRSCVPRAAAGVSSAPRPWGPAS